MYATLKQEVAFLPLQSYQNNVIYLYFSRKFCSPISEKDDEVKHAPPSISMPCTLLFFDYKIVPESSRKHGLIVEGERTFVNASLITLLAVSDNFSEKELCVSKSIRFSSLII